MSYNTHKGGKMIKIIVDSTCAPSEKYLKENGIYVNPLRILFEDKEYI